MARRGTEARRAKAHGAPTWLRRALLGALCAPVAVVVAELALRVLIPLGAGPAALEADSPQSRQPYRYDPDLFWYWDKLPDPVAEIDKDGFRRKKPVDRAPPPGVTRVALLGDSQAQGAGVAHKQTFAHLTEQALGEGWELLNAGNTGYRSLHVLRLLRLRVGAFAPHGVIIDCMPRDSERETRALLGQPLDERGRVRELLWHSRLYLVGQVILRLSGARSWESMPFPVQLPVVRDRLGPPQPERGNLDLIQAWGDENNVRVIFMTYPRKSSHIHCATGPAELPPGARVFDPCPALLQSGLSKDELFIDVNHLQPRGHAIIAEALTAALPGLMAGAGPGAAP